jgi:hypothetical protein
MAQRRQIRVSRSLEGGGERPATGYGEPEAGALQLTMDRLKPASLRDVEDGAGADGAVAAAAGPRGGDHA